MKGEYLKLETVKTIAELLNENKELRESIDKAKKLINNKKGLFTKDVVLTKVIEDLLKILKGE
jgi:ABC-type Fe3+-citrate transport system substrate-binding protein